MRELIVTRRGAEGWSKIGLVELPAFADFSSTVCRFPPFRRRDQSAFAVEDSDQIVEVPGVTALA